MISRRFLLGALLALPAAGALAAPRRAFSGGAISVDVSPLRRTGDNTDADFFAEALPVYLARAFGSGHVVRVRIDDVSYGLAGSNGQSNGNGAVDTIEGVGWVDGREVPLQSTVIATVSFPDIGGYGAHQRQDTLARSFAQWLPRQMGL